MDKEEWIPRIRSYMTERRFQHTLSMTAMMVSLAQYHGIDQTLAWKTGMLHDIAKDLSREEMLAAASKYGHELSSLSLHYQANMHAEVGALIAEHEFGLTDKDALNAIRYHFSARPDMSVLEKIVYFRTARSLQGRISQ